eukprot:sb/3473248/
MKLYLSGFEDPVSKPMCMLILGRMVQSTKFLTRFQTELVAQIKKTGEEISGKHEDLKTLISCLSALSMTETSRKILDLQFWSNFLEILDPISEGLCKKQEPEIVDLFLKHAKAEKGLVIQQNAAIALARLAKSSPILLERLRQTRGLEILHSRY